MTFDSAATDQPLVEVTDAARDLVLAYRGHSDKPNPERLAMWIEITGVSGSGFSYDMYLKSVDDATPEDAVVTAAEGLQVVIPSGSVDPNARLDNRPLRFTRRGRIVRAQSAESPAPRSAVAAPATRRLRPLGPWPSA